MGKFRKKPVVVEAYLWGNTYVDEHGTTFLHYENAPSWLIDAKDNGLIYPINPQEGVVPTIKIKTLEGDMTCNVGTWIIRGINGELYPCDPDIFEKTYEPV